MNDELFKCILINEFNDTIDCVKWLVDNDYMILICVSIDNDFGIYDVLKKFEWTGTRSLDKNGKLINVNTRNLYEK